MMHRRARFFVAAGALVAMLAASVIALSPRAATGSPKGTAPLARAAAATMLPPRDVLTLQMFSTTLGVAVARTATTGALTGSYLTETTDGGVRWRALATLPPSLALPAVPPPSIAFLSPSQGYVLDPESGALLYTADAGLHWTSVAVPGRPTHLTLVGGVLWVTSADCAPGTTIPDFCRTDLVRIAMGATQPTAVHSVPTLGPVRTAARHRAPWAATLLDWIAGHTAVFAEGVQGEPTSLLATTDGGRSFHLLTNPCTHLGLGGLAVRRRGQWILYCSLGAGQDRGTNEIWSSADDGRRWRLLAETTTGHHHNIGRIGGVVAFELHASNNGRVLWLLSGVGAVQESNNGGHSWHTAKGVTAGYDSPLATAGPRAAWLADPGVGIYRTLNGKRWRLLR